METKDDIRAQMREKRHGIKQDTRRAAGATISENLLAAPLNLLHHAWRVCIYLSTQHEIPTRYIARALWAAGREVCVPAWSKSSKAYKLYALTPRTRLITGHHGIREPAVHVPVQPQEVDAFILPGLAFDVFGGRLGYGAGHYDDILGKASRTAQKIAICYDWQVLDAPLPQEPHDIAMDVIVTDKRTVNCAARRKDQSADSGSPTVSPSLRSAVMRTRYPS